MFIETHIYYRLGSFNINYDYQTKKAITNPMVFSGFNGLTCVNCYAFLGAGVLAIVQYNTVPSIFGPGSFFRCELKVAGN